MDATCADLASAEFLVVDVETNGRAGDDCELTEVGAVLVGGGELHDEFESLVRVERPLSRGIERLTGITQAMVDDAPGPETALARVGELLRDRVLVAHSVQFDRRADAPGVYVFRDERGRPLYVGKSVSLRTRARAHFCAPAGWTERAEVVDYVPTASELGALVLENRLIKRWRPPGNVKLKRSDGYVYVRCRLDIPFPVLEVAPAPSPGAPRVPGRAARRPAPGDPRPDTARRRGPPDQESLRRLLDSRRPGGRLGCAARRRGARRSHARGARAASGARGRVGRPG